jgi:hypothetical protein
MMTISLMYGLFISFVLIGFYFAYHRIVRKNPTPLRSPSIRNRPIYREIDDIVATKSEETIELHKRLIFYRELSTLSAIVGMSICFGSFLRNDIYTIVIGWVISGLSGAAFSFITGIDAKETEVIYRRRRILSISPFVYLAEGDDAKRFGTWLFVKGVYILIFTLVTSILLLILIS